ncbi:MAG: sugar phosphate isomerase/epimerase [Saprospiraceae bacterium]|jgi:sugar phosphate isomerase/epimerase
MKITNCFLIFFALLISVSCKSKVVQNQDTGIEESGFKSESKPKLVLAQWTFNKDLFAGKMTTIDFVNKAAEMGFDGVEFVSQFIKDKVNDDAYLAELKLASETAGIKNTMISVDVSEAKLGSSDPDERDIATAKHKEWIVAASKLNCPTIRVNAHGDGSADEMMSAMFNSVKELANFGKSYNVGVTIENHGQYSSDGKWLSQLIGKLVPYGVGSVADFDNWCIEREGGKLWGTPCIKEYDRYLGMKELLPTARSVSVKAFDFDEQGNAIKTDFKRMFQLIKEAQYDEYLAIEFEGHDMDPIEGIRKTLELVDQCWK